MMVRGSVDVVTGTEVRGWAFAPGRRESVLVQAVLNHEILGETVADIHRPDLAAAGLGDGNAGYAIKLYRPIDPHYMPFLVVKVDGGDAELPRAPMLGFGEFFTSLYTSYPAAGRSRSVFGGLWTDRTDAAALLRGKREIGTIEAALEPALLSLIREGYVSLPNSIQHEAADIPDIANNIENVLEDSMLFSLLTSVLQDKPLVAGASVCSKNEVNFGQASSRSRSPSPAECIEVIIPVLETVTIDIVRDSHTLPEFNNLGISRWANSFSYDGTSNFEKHGLIDRHLLDVGNVAVMGPGTIYRLRCSSPAQAHRVQCLPERGTPLMLVSESSHHQMARKRGIQIWL